MIRAALFLLLSLCAASRADGPILIIQSAEQAVLRFREARITLTPVITSRVTEALGHGISSADFLTVRRMQPRDFQSPLADSIVRAAAKARPIYGTFAPVTETKHDTWRLNYGTATLPGVVVYLDAMTGEVLCIYELLEG